MKLRLQALRALRLNYKRRGVLVWLIGRRRCRRCKGCGRVWSAALWAEITCPVCDGSKEPRGYQRILSEPERVTQEQDAIAEGVMG
jgi:hypothetical protein